MASDDSGGFFTRAGNFFLDTLDKVQDRVIDREFGEPSGERDEGPGEFANPQTVSQPVNRSTSPGGEPFFSRHTVGLRSPLVLVGAGLAAGALLVGIGGR